MGWGEARVSSPDTGLRGRFGDLEVWRPCSSALPTPPPLPAPQPISWALELVPPGSGCGPLPVTRVAGGLLHPASVRAALPHDHLWGDLGILWGPQKPCLFSVGPSSRLIASCKKNVQCVKNPNPVGLRCYEGVSKSCIWKFSYVGNLYNCLPITPPVTFAKSLNAFYGGGEMFFLLPSHSWQPPDNF